MRTLSFRTVRNEVRIEAEEEQIELIVDNKSMATLSILDLYDLIIDTLAESTASGPGVARRRLEAQLLRSIQNYGQVIYG